MSVVYTVNGIEWPYPYVCWSVKNLLTHSLTHSRR